MTGLSIFKMTVTFMRKGFKNEMETQRNRCSPISQR